MKILTIFVSLCLMCAFDAFGGGYYEFDTHNCNPNAMRAQLDYAAADTNAVITVARCDEKIAPAVVAKMPAYDRDSVMVDYSCGKCGHEIERVVDRQYFVRETVQAYRPVVRYAPAGTYTRTRAVCD